MRSILVIPDVHVPVHSSRALSAVIRFIDDYQPDEIIQIGDLLDLPQPSRWSRGTREEFEGSVMGDSRIAKSVFLAPIREVFDGPLGVIEGNHDLRGREYLAKYAPALGESKAFNMETLLDFDGFGVDLLPDFYQVAPGWVVTHGHKGGIRISPISGNSALGAAKKFGCSVVMGHVHRAGLTYHTTGYGGTARTVTGMEVGNLVDMKKLPYLKKSTANWQHAFGLLHIDGNAVQPELITISGGKFIVDGVTYKL